MNEAVGQLTKPIERSSLRKDILATIKIGIVNSNLLTAFTGFWLALYMNDMSVWANIDKLLFMLFGSAFTVAGSCAINNYIDRDIDPIMERTKERPSATGRFKGRTVLMMGGLLIVSGLAMLIQTTISAFAIGAFGSFAYIVLYSIWTKRKYTLNTVVGSISGAVPPLIGWAAVDGNLHIYAWVFFFIMFIWQPPHFLALAMRRVEEYRAAGIPMLPVVYGSEITKRQILIWILCLLPLPFYLSSLGVVFAGLATLLTIGWFVLGIVGYKKQNETKWATKMFIYSINYLTVLCIMMVVATLF